MCASFGSAYEVSHICKNEEEKTDDVESVFEPLSDQTVRDARHRDHCFSVEGEWYLPHFSFYITPMVC